MNLLENKSIDITDFVVIAILELLLKDGHITQDMFEKAKRNISQV